MKKIVSRTVNDMVSLMGYAAVTGQRKQAEADDGKRPYEVTVANRGVILDYCQKAASSRLVTPALSRMYAGTAWNSEDRLKECQAIAASGLPESVQFALLQVLFELNPEGFELPRTHSEFITERKWILSLKWSDDAGITLLTILYRNNYFTFDELQAEIKFVNGSLFANRLKKRSDVITQCLGALYSGHRKQGIEDIPFTTERNEVISLPDLTDVQKDTVLSILVNSSDLSDQCLAVQSRWAAYKGAHYPIVCRCIASLLELRNIDVIAQLGDV